MQTPENALSEHLLATISYFTSPSKKYFMASYNWHDGTGYLICMGMGKLLPKLRATKFRETLPAALTEHFDSTATVNKRNYALLL